MTKIDEMQNLVMNIEVKVDENQEPVVSGRQLHEGLEIGTRYNDWFARMLGYGFQENQDYIPITQKRVTAQGNETTYIDHVLKLDMAKEIAMIQRSEKGKQIRQYFIQVEKEWNSPEKVMARALIMANNQLSIATEQIQMLEGKIEEMKPAVVVKETLESSKDAILVGELAKILKQNGINIGQNRLFEWMRENGYLIKRKGTDYNMPTQKSMDLGLFEIKETNIVHSDGQVRTKKTTKVTGKGQVYFINKFIKPKETGLVESLSK